MVLNQGLSSLELPQTPNPFLLPQSPLYLLLCSFKLPFQIFRALEGLLRFSHCFAHQMAFFF